MGGPYCDPPNSMRRGAFAAVAAIVVLIPFGMWLSKHFETRKLGHRPGEYFCFDFLLIFIIYLFFLYL